MLHHFFVLHFLPRMTTILDALSSAALRQLETGHQGNTWWTMTTISTTPFLDAIPSAALLLQLDRGHHENEW